MKGIVFDRIGHFSLQEVEKPFIEKSDDILIKIEASSICGSDVHILNDPPEVDAKLGVVIGHEFVGRVEEIGDGVKNFKVGDRLVCDPNIFCGYCAYCQMGIPNMCLNVETIGVDLNGGFAQYTIVPERMAVKISEDLPAEAAIFAEPLTCVMNGVRKLQLIPGENVLILGAGPIGLYFASILKAHGAGCVIVSETSEFRAGYAVTAGADIVLNPETDHVRKVVMDNTSQIGVDIVIDTVGCLFKDCLHFVRRGGRILLFGFNTNAEDKINQSDITRNDIIVYGSWIGLFTLPATVKLLENNLIDFSNLITHKIGLEQFGDALNDMRKGTALEVVIYPNDH
ncbi:MAG: alcohol dehydrogenase catalytic domain-containing protein [Christensenellales bacterium]|jgi:2-desacetyl-2-hydroxyethyl bacteriochlorophyllide A dehydrogenase